MTLSRCDAAEHIDRIALDVLAGVAAYMAQDGMDEKAVTLLAPVHERQASEFETKRRAWVLLVNPGRNLATDAARGNPA